METEPHEIVQSDLNEHEAAQLLGVGRRTLQLWRLSGSDCPRHYMMGGKLRYTRAAVLEWFEKCRSGE